MPFAATRISYNAFSKNRYLRVHQTALVEISIFIEKNRESIAKLPT
jgi:hypothetical protein